MGARLRSVPVVVVVSVAVVVPSVIASVVVVVPSTVTVAPIVVVAAPIVVVVVPTSSSTVVSVVISIRVRAFPGKVTLLLTLEAAP